MHRFWLDFLRFWGEFWGDLSFFLFFGRDFGCQLKPVKNLSSAPTRFWWIYALHRVVAEKYGRKLRLVFLDLVLKARGGLGGRGFLIFFCVGFYGFDLICT